MATEEKIYKIKINKHKQWSPMRGESLFLSELRSEVKYILFSFSPGVKRDGTMLGPTMY